MVFIYITLVVAFFDTIMWFLNTKKVEYIWHTRYPEMTLSKSHWSDRTITVIKAVVVVCIPLFNIVLLYCLIFNSDEIAEQTVKKLYAKATKEVTEQ